ncbi:uncharacterized protein LOC114310943 [Camellia sinensis]|uniref:uncharacterized protein LOC114310943 n=1 Tax=Camellia sinensis TaxID=4442 RepID=UPI0010365D81|nr:uncharacterized protein LOC114310943 [Camellia sinensis]
MSVATEHHSNAPSDLVQIGYKVMNGQQPILSHISLAMLVICDLLTRLHVYVNRVFNAITGGNATPATNELGLQIRRLCPLQSVKSRRKIDQSTKDAVVQGMLDKFVIGDDFDNDEQAQEILDRKAYLLYKNWRYNLKEEFLKLEEKGVDDPYSHSPSGVSLEDWKYLIDVAWKDEFT